MNNKNTTSIISYKNIDNTIEITYKCDENILENTPCNILRYNKNQFILKQLNGKLNIFCDNPSNILPNEIWFINSISNTNEKIFVNILKLNTEQCICHNILFNEFTYDCDYNQENNNCNIYIRYPWKTKLLYKFTNIYTEKFSIVNNEIIFEFIFCKQHNIDGQIVHVSFAIPKFIDINKFYNYLINNTDQISQNNYGLDINFKIKPFNTNKNIFFTNSVKIYTENDRKIIEFNMNDNFRNLKLYIVNYENNIITFLGIFNDTIITFNTSIPIIQRKLYINKLTIFNKILKIKLSENNILLYNNINYSINNSKFNVFQFYEEILNIYFNEYNIVNNKKQRFF